MNTLTLREQREWLFRGEIRFLSPPVGYAVYRGVASFPSDHFAIPIAWQNSTKHPVEILNPHLILSDDKQTYTFQMFGEIPEISDTAITHYTNASWAVLPPQSVTTHIMVFGIQDRWDSKESNKSHYGLRLRKDTGKELHSVLEYTLVDGSSNTKRSELFIDKLPLYEGIDKITDLHYDFFWF